MRHAGPSQSGTRVCHVVERLDYGGAETLVHRLAVGMRGTRYAPLVCCLQEGPLAAQLVRDGVTVECLHLTRPRLAHAWAFTTFVRALVRGLRDVVARHRVGILHAHLQDAILWAAAVGALEGTAVVGTYHGLGILPADRAWFDPRNHARRALYRLAARRCDRTIAVSPSVRELLCATLGFPEHRTVLLMNGVDTAAIAAAVDDGRVRGELGLAGRRVILCVGRLVTDKGQFVLLDAFAAVRARAPEAVLLLVGDGPDRDRLRRRASELGLAEHVIMAPHRRDVPDILAIAEIFVLPSFSEGISLALLEALAAGCAVVATAIPGNFEVLGHDDGQYGRLVPAGDAAGLARVMSETLEAPASALEMARRGQGRARERFDIGAMVAATEAVYEVVLAERRRAGTGS